MNAIKQFLDKELNIFRINHLGHILRQVRHSQYQTTVDMRHVLYSQKGNLGKALFLGLVTLREMAMHAVANKFNIIATDLRQGH